MKNELMICECHSPEHQYIYSYDEDVDINGVVDRTVYVHIHLNKEPFWRRIKYSIKYLFGYQSRYGAFDEFIISPLDVDKFERIVKHLKVSDLEKEIKINDQIESVKKDE